MFFCLLFNSLCTLFFLRCLNCETDIVYRWYTNKALRFVLPTFTRFCLLLCVWKAASHPNALTLVKFSLLRQFWIRKKKFHISLYPQIHYFTHIKVDVKKKKKKREILDVWESKLFQGYTINIKLNNILKNASRLKATHCLKTYSKHKVNVKQTIKNWKKIKKEIDKNVIELIIYINQWHKFVICP